MDGKDFSFVRLVLTKMKLLILSKIVLRERRTRPKKEIRH